MHWGEGLKWCGCPDNLAQLRRELQQDASRVWLLDGVSIASIEETRSMDGVSIASIAAIGLMLCEEKGEDVLRLML
jgi:hypothetical protein